jgi:hypothetical protein
MFDGAAEANTSAGAPWLICVSSAELAPKVSLTVAPGFAVSNCFAIVVNAPVSDDAASTTIVPVTAGTLEDAGLTGAELAPGALDAPAALVPEFALLELLLQPATSATAAVAATLTVTSLCMSDLLVVRTGLRARY